jgi:hypothetical protein
MLIVFIIWCFYLELSPKIGRIFIRPNSSGGYTFTFGGILQLMIQPFQNIIFWYPKMWDINIYVLWILTIIIYYLIKRL